MTTEAIDRRKLIVTVTAGAALAGTASSDALAYQGNMERALSSLFNALASLRESTPNKGGHRVNAMRLIEQAISETQAGIEFAE